MQISKCAKNNYPSFTAHIKHYVTRQMIPSKSFHITSLKFLFAIKAESFLSFVSENDVCQ